VARESGSGQPARVGRGGGSRARKATTAQASPQEQNNRLRRERDDALEQLAATAEVLKVISRSTFDLQAVLATLVQSAGKLCQAENVQIVLRDGEYYRLAADNGFSPEYQQYVREHPIKPGRGTLVGRTALGVVPVQITDALADPGYTYHEGRRLGGFRTMLGVPLVRDGKCVGVISLTRSKVHPFTDRQIELVRNFAAQAVIAIENTRLLNELRESLRQQTATADVLKVISRSTFDLQSVLGTLTESAARLCSADMAAILRQKGTAFYYATSYNFPPEFVDFAKTMPIEPGRGTCVGRVLLEGKTTHIHDAASDPEYTMIEGQRRGGYHTILGVPLLRAGAPIGVIVLTRRAVQPFTEKQIELVTTFADQAVIAIENVRLFDDVQKRTQELTESLEQQTATSEVLKVISSSPGELQLVFDTMLAKASELCEASYGLMWLREGDAFRAAALHGDLPQAYVEQWRHGTLFRPGPHVLLSRVAISGQPLQVADLRTDASYLSGDPLPVAAADVAGIRTLLGVPMLRDKQVVGAIGIYRKEVKPFTDKQVELVTNFAAQAVIAIENARLLNELRDRTNELSESLQQQTATTDVLKVISSSPGDLKPVFNAMLRNATQICEANFANLALVEGQALRMASMHNAPTAYEVSMREDPLVPLVGTPAGYVIKTGQLLHIADLHADETHRNTRLVKLAGARTALGVPLLKDNKAIGTMLIYRQEVRPFTEKQIELVRNFAAQAVIAIENTRLLKELRESLQRQTATADVLKAISRSTFDLKTVLDALVEAAARLCEADQGTIARERDGVYQRVATHGFSDKFKELVKNLPVIPERGTATGRALLEGKLVHIADVRADPEYTFVDAQKLGGFRTVLSVPMLREGVPIGVLALTRQEVNPFTDKQIELVTTFADQAAIAIENVRLFESVEARTRELAKSLEDLRTAQDRLVQTEKLASLGQLTAGIAHEIKNPLNFVNNFSAVSTELIDELQDTLSGIVINQRTRTEVNELTDTLRGNLNKVVQHGKRADAIVKNMLLHSRQGSGEHRPVDINGLVEESLNLAYHGARAEKQGFNITLQRSLDPTAGDVDVFPQDITRVLLNLISNGFYAATKRKAEGNGSDYEPTLTAVTKNLGDRVEIRIRDNGTGIPPEVKEKLFTPFFTTKPAGEGTGLGLSISHDIIVKQHSGSIEVDTEPGEFTEFRIILPRTLAASGART
jgi:two-component system NtrC family sensor kinase